jgi:DNA-directed RNA polymerase specialized sigma24 family protein
LAERFEEHRGYLRAVILGSISDADDAVQEARRRMSQADIDGIHNPRGWLTRVVARMCLDVLPARASPREESLDAHLPDPIIAVENGIGGARG